MNARLSQHKDPSGMHVWREHRKSEEKVIGWMLWQDYSCHSCTYLFYHSDWLHSAGLLNFNTTFAPFSGRSLLAYSVDLRICLKFLKSTGQKDFSFVAAVTSVAVKYRMWKQKNPAEAYVACSQYQLNTRREIIFWSQACSGHSVNK